MHRFLIPLLSLALVTAACGSDGGGGGGGGGGDGAALCEMLGSDETIDVDDPEALEAMDAMVALAPGDIRDAIEVIADVGRQLAEVPEDDPDALGDVFALVLNPEVVAAGEEIEAWGTANCGFEAGWFSEDDTLSTDDPFADDPFGDTTPTDDPFGDTGGDLDFSTDVAENWAGLDDVDAFLDEHHADADWVDLLTGKGSGPGVLSVYGDDVDGDQAVAACEALREYAAEWGIEIEIDVSTSDLTELATGTTDDACAAA